MQLIKLDATDSTNAYLKKLVLQKLAGDFTVVQADTQYAGRGQMGTVWVSEPGKNLTFSILKSNLSLRANSQFIINMVTCLGMFSALSELSVPDLKIKWPNDILSGYDKICGILIENMTSGRIVQSTIIGVGLNVNQREFPKLEHVSSLQLILGNYLNPDEVLQVILKHLKLALSRLGSEGEEQVRASYEDHLFRKNRPSTFRDNQGGLFTGIIRGVGRAGKLKVELEDRLLKEFDLKEVQLVYWE
jgi:BirA family transcriptional regulator, biotin operon repressor / biotin---[acetyl-CoA-carboxylase] ligase